MGFEPGVVRVVVVRNDQVAGDQVQKETHGPNPDHFVIQRALQYEIAFGPELRQLFCGQVTAG